MTEETLSDLDENDMSTFILSNEEYKLKKMLWELMFKEWMEDQKEKCVKKKSDKKKRNVKSHKADSQVASNPVEAIKNSDRFGKKLNYNLVRNLFTR